ncbi:DNA primase [Streptomyces sp. NPDC003038]|uniref:DNA primase n=1 Tax=unclassified Streptomyces TaxID=2593676 RepID=UPI0033A081B1
MNNRIAIGLAVGAGYALGRTKKAKLALGVGTLIMSRNLPFDPRAVADLAATRLQKNPRFKELGDQLREDLRGVGTAASGAVLGRYLDGLADRLHDRTQGVQERLSGLAGTCDPERPDRDGEEADDAQRPKRAEAQKAGAEQEDDEHREDDEQPTRSRRPARRPAGEKAAGAGAGSGGTRSAPARRTAQKKTAAPEAKKSSGARQAKGGRSRA